MNTKRAAGIGLSAMLVAGSAVAEDLRAVEDLNLQVTVSGGVNDDEAIAFVAGKGAFPIGDLVGVQIEGAVGNREYYGAAAHIFWRNPDLALAGVFGSLESLEGVELVRGGAEVELYLGQFTIAARGGFQELNNDSGAFGRADVYWYPIDTLVLRAGVEATPDFVLGRASAEIQPMFADYPAFSIFGEGSYGEDDNYTALAGFRLHFGAPGFSLRQRERREDPSFAILNHITIEDEILREQARALGAAQIDCSQFVRGELIFRGDIPGELQPGGWVPVEIPEQCLNLIRADSN